MSRVMVVEDDPDLRAVVVEVLESDGHDVVQAENGKRALDLLRSGPLPGLVLLDLMMPVLSGAELLELLQDDAALREVPVVVVSAFASSGEAPGVKQFVRKPITAPVLRTLVQAYATA